MLTTGLMSSNTDMWATPKAFFARMDKEFHFDLDVCATVENAKCARFYTPADPALHARRGTEVSDGLWTASKQ